MKTNVPNFLIMAVPEKKSGFSVFGPKTGSRYKNQNRTNFFRFGTAMAGQTAKKTSRVTLETYFGRPNPRRWLKGHAKKRAWNHDENLQALATYLPTSPSTEKSRTQRRRGWPGR